MKIRVDEGRLVQTVAEHGTDWRAFGEFVGPRGELASYALGWTPGGNGGRVTVGIGVGNEGGGTFHAAVRQHEGDIAYGLVDEPFETVPQGGPDLTAAESRAHEDLPFVWAVVDIVMVRDSRASWLRHCILGTTSIATEQVLAGVEPILSVSHAADDGTWQLVGTSDGTVDNGRISHLHHFVEHDPTLLDVLDLEPGERATRRRVGGRWKRVDLHGRATRR
ncbi:hypothetical protein [Antribacter gilvus]|uniref:hypothetical protein n=1 Tax=Antribacter gilvus TaxID=2304675 RepID=UPI000F78DF01|nr:hypothetical protein [Antribacter gilvus]